jgi:integrase/recombinase XerD
MLNNKIINICEKKLIYFNYSKNTINNYIHHIKLFLVYLNNKQISHVNSFDFQNYLDNYKFSSVSQQNQVINSIKFLYEKVLDKKYEKVNFKRPRKEVKLPKPIDMNYLINKLSNYTKHKA